MVTVSGLLPGDYNNLFMTLRTANGTSEFWQHGTAYTGATRAFSSIHCLRELF